MNRYQPKTTSGRKRLFQDGYGNLYDSLLQIGMDVNKIFITKDTNGNIINIKIK